MNDFSFQCRTKTSFGKNALAHLPFDLYAMGSAKPLVIQDRSSHLAALTKPLVRAFADSGMTLGLSRPLPGSEDRDEAARHIRSLYEGYREKGYDALIALGGETASDAAKALNIAVSLGPDALKQGKIDGPLAPFIYLPTGVETGRATTGTARFSNRNFASQFLAPDQAVIDPALLTADSRDTLLDAALTCLCTAAEIYALSGNPPARAYGAVIIEMTVTVLDELTASGLAPQTHLGKHKKEEKRWQTRLVQAAVMTGYLISGAGVPLTHDLAARIAAGSRISRGQVMLILLPGVLASSAAPDLDRMLLPLSGPDRFSSTPPGQQAAAAVQAVRDLVSRLHLISRGALPRTLEEAGWNRAALDSLVRDTGNLEITAPGILDTILDCACNGRAAAGN